MIKNVVEGLPEEISRDLPSNPQQQQQQQQPRDPTIPKEIFEDDYFRRNLPSTYGSASVDLGDGDVSSASSAYGGYDAERSIFGEETERCSKGFQVGIGESFSSNTEKTEPNFNLFN